MKRPRAIDRPKLFSRCLVSVSMLLELLALMCIPCAVFPHGWPKISCSNGLWCERSATAVAPAYPFMEFCHNARSLVATYTYQNRVCKPMPEQLPIDQGVLVRIFLYFSGFRGLQREYSISQEVFVGHHPGFTPFNQENLQQLLHWH